MTRANARTGLANRALRVFHCIPNLAGGGAERQLCILAKGLCERGVQVHVTCVPTGENLSLLSKTGCVIDPISSRSSYDPRILRQILRYIQNAKPDIIQTWLPQMDVIGGIAARLSGIPFLLSERSSALGHPVSFRTIMRRGVAHLASGIVANSNAGKDYWQGRVRCPISVIRNGIALDLSEDQVRDRFSCSRTDPPTILFVGRYHSDKNAIETAKGVADIIRRIPLVRADFLGAGPQEKILRKIEAEPELEGRLSIGPFTADARGAMRRAAIFVSASRYEGHPNAVIEAAMAGISLVLSDIPAHREMFGSEDCYYIDGWSAAAIAEGIERALHDPSDASRRAISARAKASAFSIDAMIGAYQQLYETVLGESRK